MRIYPDDFINKIILGDCLEVMKDIPDNSIDLTVTSPPYDSLRDYKGYKFDFESVAKELYRITKVGGVLVWIVGDKVISGSESCTSFKQAIKFTEIGFLLHDTMIYEKAGTSFPEKVRYYQAFEYMFILTKEKPKNINLIKDKPNKWAGQTTFGNSSNRMKDGSIKSFGKRKINDFGVRINIWRYANGYGYGQANKLAYGHPATFPEKLAEDHIISWSNENDIVLDPMCGSGTTCRMAKLNNRNFIGIEISNEYCDLANRILEGQHANNDYRSK